MVMLTFIFVLLLPLVFLLPSLNENIWDDVHKDNLVKHKLLATSLVEPIRFQVLSYQDSLKSLGGKLQKTDLSNLQQAQRVMQDFANLNEDIVAITLLLSEKGTVTTAIKKTFQLSSRYTDRTKTVYTIPRILFLPFSKALFLHNQRFCLSIT
jgi:hypothetical protein